MYIEYRNNNKCHVRCNICANNQSTINLVIINGICGFFRSIMMTYLSMSKEKTKLFLV